jgi:hypothetical protein
MIACLLPPPFFQIAGTTAQDFTFLMHACALKMCRAYYHCLAAAIVFASGGKWATTATNGPPIVAHWWAIGGPLVGHWWQLAHH